MFKKSDKTVPLIISLEVEIVNESVDWTDCPGGISPQAPEPSTTDIACEPELKIANTCPVEIEPRFERVIETLFVSPGLISPPWINMPVETR
tara:strand:- start:7 stop:282 length:276 start_codon:yes stop_codon:yes gene_type:complete